MTEDEARAWIGERFGAPAVDRLSDFARLLVAETARQNLVSSATLPDLWSRHLVDSAQLALWGGSDGLWLDIGSGGGLPGLVLALLLDRPFVLSEPRALRARFLAEAAAALGIGGRVSVEQRRVEAVRCRASTISARAVAPIDRLIAAARHCADAGTCWVLPRGQSAAEELHSSMMRRTGLFHVKQSVTNPAAGIVVATGIAAR